MAVIGERVQRGAQRAQSRCESRYWRDRDMAGNALKHSARTEFAANGVLRKGFADNGGQCVQRVQLGLGAAAPAHFLFKGVTHDFVAL